jgi:hypothetical protein
MPGCCEIEVIDLIHNPELAKADQIVVGDLSDRPRVLYYLAIAGGSK